MKLQSAQHVGRRHLRDGRNLQDALVTFETPDLIAGVICDGCSEGKHSEVGANLAAAYLISQIKRCPRSWPAPIVINTLHLRLTNYLDMTAGRMYFANDHERTQFVKDYLLFTVLGFIWTPTEVTTFYVGDGTLIVNDDVHHLNAGDTPLYPAYALISHALTIEQKTFPFQVDTFTDVQRFAIGSDAWKDEPDLVPNIWGKSWLQREINRLSDRDHRFADDVSIITLEQA